MAERNSNRYLSGITPVSASSHEAITVVCEVAITAASDGLADGDFLNLCIIPAGHKVAGLALWCGDLDAHETPALTFSVGLRDAADVELETVFITESTLGQAGGTLYAPTAVTMWETAALAANKILSVEVIASAATKHADARKFGAVVTYIAKR
jgi:hypothetical protein